MKKFCFFCITYSNDYKAFVSMINSFKQHNASKIPFIVAVQNENIYTQNGGGWHDIANVGTFDDFKAFEDDCIKVIQDTDFASSYLIKNKVKSDLSIGYLNQEIAKLAFFEYKFAEHYLCIDSDTIFIRDFYVSDFFYDDITPYIVLVQDKDLHAKNYYINFAKDRIKCIQKIFDFLEVEDSRLRTCHNGQIFSHKVLCSLMEFMKSKNLTFCDLLLIAPFEFTWYNAYFQKTSLIREVAVEPFFKMYHTKSEYILDRLSGNRISNLKSQYIGYILNSNWSKGELRFKNRGILDRILYLFLTKFT